MQDLRTCPDNRRTPVVLSSRQGNESQSCPDFGNVEVASGQSGHKSMEESESSGISTSESEQLKELEKWKEKAEKAEKQKSEMLLLKLDANEKSRTLQKDLTVLKDQENKRVMERMRIQEMQRMKLSLINEQNNKLRKEIQALRLKLAAKKANRGNLTPSFSLKQYLPEKKMKFAQLENVKKEDEYLNMSCRFHIATKVPFRMSQGEALVQFEEESVAQQLIRKGSHIVNLEKKKVDLKAHPVTLDMGTTFELHVTVSQRKVNVSNIPNTKIPEEWMRDKLELLFCKAKLGEIQKVSYDQQAQMALVTFAHPIVLSNIIKHGKYPLCIHGRTHVLTVSPITENKLERVQMFSGTSRKTVLLTGINIKQEDEENVEDMIEIHFQKPSNGGGEVDKVTYIPKGTKIAYFESDTGNVV